MGWSLRGRTDAEGVYGRISCLATTNNLRLGLGSGMRNGSRWRLGELWEYMSLRRES